MSNPEFYPQVGGHPPAPGGAPTQLPDGYPQQYSAESYPPESYPPESYPPQSYPPGSYPPESYPPQSYPPGSYPPRAYRGEPYAPDSYPPDSYPPDAYPPGSHQPQQYQTEQYQPEHYQPEQYQPESYPLELPGSEAASRERRPASAGASPSRWLAILGLFVLVLGLLLPEGGHTSLGRVPLWALFAGASAVAVVVGVFRVAAGGDRLAVLAAAGLAGYWLLLVLPGVASQAGFLQTAGCALCCGAAWLCRTGPAAGP